ncbi:DDE-type integrase/transposase/recombinase [Rhodococcus sp. IEGM 1379]|uniref:DDE-type integrase/transposase/recombinase n=1 Tax=Rhodococcus sp. IEGM 1379 TaxID=3047086 RepID=UPI0024B6B8F8|nr:DDE-type integrase/transposase/recombinase [Rhodococcus sp. IEGM 1379]MDI9916808.1 DDE-type integrase/transposase/recombinase [Rhodococcus sp. IEGM 1379]
MVTQQPCRHYLWRAVDQDGTALGRAGVSPSETPRLPHGFFRKLLKGLEYVPRVIVTDTLGSYQVAHRELMPSVEHRRSRYVNDRAENSHQPTRQRERVMRRFTSPGHAQRFLSAFGVIGSHLPSETVSAVGR